MRPKTPIAVLAAVLIVVGGAAAFAVESAANDALAIQQAKFTLTQAIAAAEQNAGGRASKAEYERSKQ